jgi:hypothetical protein
MKQGMEKSLRETIPPCNENIARISARQSQKEVLDSCAVYRLGAQQAYHHLGIDEVFRAAQGDKAHGGGSGRGEFGYTLIVAGSDNQRMLFESQRICLNWDAPPFRAGHFDQSTESSLLNLPSRYQRRTSE